MKMSFCIIYQEFIEQLAYLRRIIKFRYCDFIGIRIFFLHFVINLSSPLITDYFVYHESRNEENFTIKEFSHNIVNYERTRDLQNDQENPVEHRRKARRHVAELHVRCSMARCTLSNQLINFTCCTPILGYVHQSI